MFLAKKQEEILIISITLVIAKKHTLVNKQLVFLYRNYFTFKIFELKTYKSEAKINIVFKYVNTFIQLYDIVIYLFISTNSIF